MGRRIAGIVAVAISVVALASCASTAPPPAAPTVTVTAQPAPAPTVTIEAEPDADVPLTDSQAWTICASVAFGVLNAERSAYTRASPMTEDSVVDHGDTTFAASVLMDPAEGSQPVNVDCNVSGSMSDPRVTYELHFYDSQ